MALDGKKPVIQDACVLKTNDLSRLQDQLVTLIQSLANIFSDGIITGLELSHSGELPKFIPGQGWSIDQNGFITVSEGMAKAVNGELLIIESDQITIPDTTFWDQTNIPNSGKDIWVYKTGEETIKMRPNILGQAKKVVVRNTYAVSIGTEPSSNYPAKFKLCIVPNLNISMELYKFTQVPNLSIISKNFALKSLTHTGNFAGSVYTGPKLRGYNAIEQNSITSELITIKAVQNKHIDSVDGSKIFYNSIDKTKIISVDGSAIENKTIDYTKIKDYTIINQNLGFRCIGPHNIQYSSLIRENFNFKLSWSKIDLKKNDNTKYYIYMPGVGNLKVSWGTHLYLDGVYYRKDQNGNVRPDHIRRIADAFFIDSGNKRIANTFSTNFASTVKIVGLFYYLPWLVYISDTGLILGIDTNEYLYISVSPNYHLNDWICCHLEVTLV